MGLFEIKIYIQVRVMSFCFTFFKKNVRMNGSISVLESKLCKLQ